jgi:ESS family glutamate:Na+ symporter
MLSAVIWTLFYLLSGISVEFDMQARDILLVYFFTTIGINAGFSDLLRGGKPLVILLVLTVIYMFVQNFIGIGIAALFEMSDFPGARASLLLSTWTFSMPCWPSISVLSWGSS